MKNYRVLTKFLLATTVLLLQLSVIGSAQKEQSTSPSDNIVDNGDFEVPDIGTQSFKPYYSGAQLGGWVVESGSVDIVHYWQSADGDQSLDLEGYTVGAIYQDLDTSAYDTYILSFAFAGNPDGAPTLKPMQIWWGDTVLDTLTFDTTDHSSSDMGWEAHQYTVTAVSSTTRLKFKALTSGYSYGPVIDSVSVHPLAVQPPHRPFFVAINKDREMYAFPVSDQPNSGHFIGVGSIAAVSDFDNDGFCEVLAIRESDAKLYLYESDGGTGFVEQIVSYDAYPSTDFYFSFGYGDSAVGDFDNNGFLDFAFSGRRCSSTYCSSGGQGLIQIQLNQGNGNFERHSIDVSGVLNHSFEGIEGIDDGDFNNDDTRDLIVQQYWNGADNVTHLFSGNGDGTFVDIPVFTNPNSSGNQGGVHAAVSGDFNNDGNLDVIVGQDDDGEPGQTWLYLGNGNGEFTYVGTAYDTNPTDESGVDKRGSGHSDAYDIDLDGNLDVIVTAERVGLLLFKGNGDGSFQSPNLDKPEPIRFRLA